MYMLQECRRLLQRGDEILLDAPDLSRDDARAVDVLAFTAAASSTSAAQPVAQEPDMDEEEVVQGGSAAEAPDDEAAEAPDQQHPEPPPEPSPFIDPSVREAGENPDNLTDTIGITTLTNTTSVYVDWLHRGPFPR